MSAVNVSSVADFDDKYGQQLVPNLVDDSVVSYTDAEKSL
jgi:hypothetical protein